MSLGHLWATALFLGLPEWLPGLLWGIAVALFFLAYITNFRNWVYKEPPDGEEND